MSSYHLVQLHFQFFQLLFHHCFNKLFTTFLVVVIDIRTKHNLFFPIGYRKVCCSSSFAMWKTENCGCRYDGFYFFSPKHLRCKQKSSYLFFAVSIWGLAIRAESREGKTISTLPIKNKASQEAFLLSQIVLHKHLDIFWNSERTVTIFRNV